MKLINGIKTNLGGNYSIGKGEDTKRGRLYIKNGIYESDAEMFERLSKYGFKKITFYYATTCVKGLYDTYAICYE